MNIPATSVYEILEVKPTTGTSIKLSMREVETQKIEGPVYAVASKLKLPLVVGQRGRATFTHQEGRNPKPGDKGYLGLEVWCAVGGTPPPANPTGGQPSIKPTRPEYQLDGRDRSIIAQSSMKAAADYYASAGVNDPSDPAKDIIELASLLSKGVIRIMNE